MRLPFLFNRFDAEAEQTSLRILKGIGRFEDNEHIPEDAITHVMLNEELRARLGPEENEDVEATLIRDALVEEMRTQTETEKKRAQKLNDEVKERDSNLLILAAETEAKDREIETLKMRVAAEETKALEAEKRIEGQGEKIQEIAIRLECQENANLLKNALLKYGFLLLIILAISGGLAWWVSQKLLSLDSPLFQNLARALVGSLVFVFFHLILEIWAKGHAQMNQLWPFRLISDVTHCLSH